MRYVSAQGSSESTTQHIIHTGQIRPILLASYLSDDSIMSRAEADMTDQVGKRHQEGNMASSSVTQGVIDPRQTQHMQPDTQPITPPPIFAPTMAAASAICTSTSTSNPPTIAAATTPQPLTRPRTRTASGDGADGTEGEGSCGEAETAGVMAS